MGMGRAATGGFQNASNNVQSGMGGKGKGGGSSQPAYQPQGGFGGKGAGQYQPQVQQPQGGFSGKGGQQQQNPYAQQYYQPQFQPQTFNNPYAQGGFGQQMGGMGGKGGQQQNDALINQATQLPPDQRANFARQYQQYEQRRGGMGGKGAGQYMQPQVQQPQGGFGGKGGQRDNSQQAYNQFMASASFAPGSTPPTYEQWAAQRQSADKMGPILQKPGVPQRDMGYGNGQGVDLSQYINTISGQPRTTAGPGALPYNPTMVDNKTVPNLMPRRDLGYGNGPGRGQMGYLRDIMQGQPSGLAALQQPTATTQAASPAPEQPYMGNYLQ